MTYARTASRLPSAELPLSQSVSHAETASLNASAPSTPDTETDYDYCEKTEISTWEDEGGAGFVGSGRVHRQRGVDMVSPLTAHIKAAETLMDSGEYEAAYGELEAAAVHFAEYRDALDASFETSINRLANYGCRATPPHPVALPLIKLRRMVAA